MAVATLTSLMPAVPAGVVTVTEVEVFDLIEVAETPPIFTEVTLVKPVPVIVIVSPPVTSPEAIEIAPITGGAE